MFHFSCQLNLVFKLNFVSDSSLEGFTGPDPYWLYITYRSFKEHGERKTGGYSGIAVCCDVLSFCPPPALKQLINQPLRTRTVFICMRVFLCFTVSLTLAVLCVLMFDS